MSDILTTILPVLDPQMLALLFGSVALGIVAGALPGISATMGVAIASPLTFTMDPLSGILCLLGVYCGAIFGGSISAILLGIPGTPGAVATTFDGNAMAKRGEAREAIGIAAISSFFGGIFSALVLGGLSYPIASFALAFGPREYLALVAFALTAVASLSGTAFLRGALTGFLGLFLATIGIDETFGISRFHYGSSYLIGGIAFVPVMIGLFAIPEVLATLETRLRAPKLPSSKGFLPRLTGLHRLLPTQMRSSVIGLIVGAVPGAGADIAAIVSYAQGKTWSRHRAEFGKGSPHGLASAETANNAATGGSLIPLLTLGIPGGAVTAILLGTFMIHGLQPGPLLLENNATLVYQIFFGFALANFAMLGIGYFASSLLGKVLLVPQHLMATVILVLCIVGAYAIRNNVSDIATMLAVGVFGYVLLKLDFPRAPLALGLILGPMLEAEMTRTMLVMDHWLDFFSPISTVIWLLAVLVIALPGLSRLARNLRSRRRQSAGMPASEQK